MKVFEAVTEEVVRRVYRFKAKNVEEAQCMLDDYEMGEPIVDECWEMTKADVKEMP